MKRACAITLVFMSLCASNANSQAGGDYEKFNDSFRFYVGGFYPQMSSAISINGSDINPPPIDIEDQLGVEDGKFVPYGGVKWRISRRNSLEFEYFQLNRDGFIDLIPDPIEVGDLLIEAGTINTAFDTGVGRLTYGFSLMRSERSDLQIKAGLHIADFSIGLQLAGAVCDQSLGEVPPCPTGQTPPQESEDVTAPLPHFGLSWAYAFSENVVAEVRAIGFALELDGIEGSIVELSGDIAWKPWRHFGLGAGLRYFNTNVEATTEDLNGEFDFEYFGPSIFVGFSF